MPCTPPIVTPLPRVTNNSLEFWWQPPANTDGFNVFQYVLKSEPPIDKFMTSSSTFSYRVDGLTPGIEYAFYIQANTDEPVISESAYFVPSIPGLKATNPIITTSTTYSNDTGLVTWNPPISDGEAAVKYYVLRSTSYESGGYSNVIAVPGYTSSAIVSTIASAYNWYYTVEAVNDPGYSFPAYTSKWFLPINTSNCSLWLDAADPLTIQKRQIIQGGPIFVTGWLDKSGNGFNATNVTPTLCPVYTPSGINNLAVLDFYRESGQCFLDSLGWTVGSTFTNILVANIIGTTSGTLIEVNDTIVNGIFYYNVDNGSVIAGVGGTDYAAAAITPMTAIFTFIYKGYNATGGIEIWMNGVLISAATNANGAADIGTNGIRIGDQFESTLPFNNYIGETIWYPYEVDTSTRQKLEGYLAWKWGLQLSLPDDHPYASSPPLA